MEEPRIVDSGVSGAGHAAPDALQRVEAALQQWKKSLIDFGRGNKLLFFNTSRRTRLRFVLPSAETLYDGLVLRDKSFSFGSPVGVDIAVAELEDETRAPEIKERKGDIAVDYERSSAKDVRVLQQKLFRLRSDGHTILSEQGINTLHLALGLLHWKEVEHSPEWIQTPILLVPVSLERQKNSPYRLAAFEGDAVVNPTLQFKLDHDFGIRLPSFEAFDGFGERADLPGFLAAVGEVVGPFPGWHVELDAWLSHFSFQKLVMYEDLSADGTAEEMASHAVLAALCEVADPDMPEASLEALDSQFDLPSTYPVVEADSSQLEVMARVKAGQSLVVQGPPGTGKSQTIVNLIAQGLRDGKSVLFVSEKRAALDVVHRRLREVGLGELCLELHSHRANKRQVVTDIYQATQSAWDRVKRPNSRDFDRRRDLREQLDAYARALHSPRDKQGRSAYTVLGRLARLASAPWLSTTLPVRRYAELTPVEEDRLEQLVGDVAATGVWDNAPIHPWQGARFQGSPLDIEPLVIPAIEQMQESMAVIRESADRIKRALGSPLDASNVDATVILAHQVESLAEIPAGVQPDWLSTDGRLFEATLSLIQECLQKLDRLDACGDRLDSAGLGGLRDATGVAEDVLSRYSTRYKQPLRRLSASYRTDKKQLRQLTGRRLRYSRALPALGTAVELHDLDSFLKQQRAQFRRLAGVDLPRDREPRATLAAATEWARSFRMVSPHKFSPAAARKLTDRQGIVRRTAEEEIPQLRKTLEALGQGIGVLNGQFPDGLDGIPFRAIPYSSLTARASEWLASRTRIREWNGFQRALEECQAAGLEGFIEEARKRHVRSGHLIEAWKRLFFTGWLAEAYKSDPVLGGFDATGHGERVIAFGQLDKALLAQAQAAVHVAARLRQEVVRQAAQYENLGGGRHRYVPNRAARDEYVLIKKEFNKQRRHLPLRRLLPKVPILLSAVKPCLLMSPLSVASYLPRHTYNFDLAIFDEASQILPADAIGAILRCTQLVVMGDTKQLPPTSFFQRQMQDGDTTDEEDSDATSYQSILELCATVLPEARLVWHYRSRDERLIAFSNKEFYRRSLITFPSPNRSGDTGVRLDYVPNGAYGRGGSKTNLPEAARVVDLIIRHLEDYGRERSLGVVALSLSQRDAIELELRRRLLKRPELEQLVSEEGPEPFFIKNLETVQGDERDEIVMSVGYGPSDPGGAPSLSFGPLNLKGGERRLNVAVTRAKYRMTLVASMRPEQLDGAVQSRWDGPRILASYFRYAGRGGRFEADGEPAEANEPEDDFEEAVRDALVARGFAVDCQVGSSGFRIDLAVEHPDIDGRYILGLECDGATYHSSRTTRDRDRLRQEILETQGWSIHRIWSPDWVQDPERVLDLLVQRIESLRSIQEPGIRRLPSLGESPQETETAIPPAPALSDAASALLTSPLDPALMQVQRDRLLHEGVELEHRLGSPVGADPKASAAIADALRRKLSNVQAALRRIDTGTYGACVRCGGAIDLDRLEAVPATPLCRQCAG